MSLPIQTNMNPLVRQDELQKERPAKASEASTTAAARPAQSDAPPQTASLAREPVDVLSNVRDENRVKPQSRLNTAENAGQTANFVRERMTQDVPAAVSTHANASPEAVLAMLRAF